MNRSPFLLKFIFLFSTIFILSCSASEQTLEIKNFDQIENSDNQSEKTKAEIITLKNDELITKNLLQNRDLSLYLQGGHFGWKENQSKNEKTVRDFIWQCWNEKKRGYIRITYNSLEGMISTSHIFIEPKENENWRVIWRIVRSENVIDDVPEINTVERVENKPKKGEWALIFIHETGKVLQRLPDFYEESNLIR